MATSARGDTRNGDTSAPHTTGAEAASATIDKLTIIGGGKMGGPFAGRVVETGLLPPQRVVVGEPVPAIREALAQRLGVTALDDNRAAVAEASVVLLAVTPQVMPVVLDQLQGHLAPGQLVMSIAAGVTLETLQRGLGHEALIRVMPNTPAQVGQGISAWIATPTVAPHQKAQAQAILRAVGRELEVTREVELDMVTAVSGSGPAWIMLMVEAMIDAAVQIGLRPDWARELVLQTMSGSVELARQAGKHPAELRSMVTTPGGTTAAGLYAMERAGLRTAIADGIVAAHRRSLELGEAARRQRPS
jgi:pyrroline-5-carboxylate reductase